MMKCEFEPNIHEGVEPEAIVMITYPNGEEVPGCRECAERTLLAGYARRRIVESDRRQYMDRLAAKESDDLAEATRRAWQDPKGGES